MTHAPYTFFSDFFHVQHNDLHVVNAIFVAALLIVAGALVYPRIRKAHKAIVPSASFGIRSILEAAVQFVTGLADDIIGHGGRAYVPFLGTIFLFIFLANLIGLIPGFLPATANWATGAAVAAVVFLGYNYFGFKANGIGYLKHFFAPIKVSGVLATVLLAIPLLAFQCLFGTIELISSLLRPVTLSIRLFVNISADHTVAHIFEQIFPYVLPLPFLILGLLVAFLQAFIFMLLTMVYISLAVAHEH